MNIVFIMMSWIIYPYVTNIYFINYSILLLIIFTRLRRYILLLIGWSSNSNYAIIGSLRSIAQVLSYEIRFIIIILVIIILRESYSIYDIIKWQNYCWYLIWLIPLRIMFFVRILAELNRSPIDFIEGESELVSGFNIEYFRGSFALIFIVEYGYIIFFRIIIIIMFTNLLINYIYIYIVLIIIVRIVIFVRGILPRIRYDELIYLCWKIILPLILNYLLIILGFKSLLTLIN